jgi:hypothetical protein
MDLIVDPKGRVRGLYSEEINYHVLGEVTVSRASYVEPDRDGIWWADLALMGGPRLGPFARRSEALAAEARWLETYWLAPSSIPS